MEVTLRMVVAFALLGLMALLAGSIANQQTTEADSTLDSQTLGAKCDLWKVQSEEARNDPNRCNRAEWKYRSQCDAPSESACTDKFSGKNPNIN